MANLYSLPIEGLSLRERKDLLDFCLRRRRLEVRTADLTYPFEYLTRLPARYDSTPFHAILYTDQFPAYFVSSNNLQDAMEEMEVSSSNVRIVLYEDQ